MDLISTLYARVGAEKLTKMVAGFYRRVRTDELLSPMYDAEDWAGAEDRLRSFLFFRFGGPANYLMERGHPRLRVRHLPFSIGEPERRRWLDLMANAMSEAEIPADPAAIMKPFFEQVANAMVNRESTPK